MRIILVCHPGLPACLPDRQAFAGMTDRVKIMKKNKAFSLPEVIISMFIFVLIMLVVTSVFVTMVKTRKEAREAQRNMESIRYAVELMAKNIRMSRVDSPTGVNETLYIFNNSQGKCLEFSFDDETKNIKTREADYRDDCKTADFGNEYYLTNFSTLSPIENVKFFYVPYLDSSEGDTSLGHVTVSVKMVGVQESAQTSVALRNYSDIGQ